MVEFSRGHRRAVQGRQRHVDIRKGTADRPGALEALQAVQAGASVFAQHPAQVVVQHSLELRLSHPALARCGLVDVQDRPQHVAPDGNGTLPGSHAVGHGTPMDMSLPLNECCNANNAQLQPSLGKCKFRQ